PACHRRMGCGCRFFAGRDQGETADSRQDGRSEPLRPLKPDKIARFGRRSPAEAVFAEEMNLWDEILARVETKVNRHSFYTWFKPTTFLAADTQSLTIRVPNPLFKDWLMKHYAGVIGEAMNEVKHPNLAVHFVAEPQNEGTPVALSVEEAVAFENEPAAAAPGPAGLNPRYTFDTFIVGSSNQFAHPACRAVAEAPSRS